MTASPAGRENRVDHDLRTLLADYGAGHVPDVARIRARLDEGLGIERPGVDGLTFAETVGRAPHSGRRSRPPARIAAVAAAGLVAAAALLFVVIDERQPLQVSTTGPAAGPLPLAGGTDGQGDDRHLDGDVTGSTLPSSPDAAPYTPADGQAPVAGADVPGIRVPAGGEPGADPGADPETVGGPTTPAAVGPGGSPGPDGGGSSSTTSPAGGGTTTGGTVAAPSGAGAGAGGGGGGGAGGGGNSPTTAAPAATAPVTARPTSTSAAPSTTARATTTTREAMVAGPAIQAALLPNQVVLGPTGHLDWVIVGSRNDGKIVRMKAGTGRLSVTAPTGAAATKAPIPFLWSGGVPEQDRTVNTLWWTANGVSSSFVVQVSGTDNASEVVLYTGGSRSVTITVAVAGRGTSQKVLPAGLFGSAGKVTIALTGADKGHDVTITVGASGGVVSLGAVTER